MVHWQGGRRVPQGEGGTEVAAEGFFSGGEVPWGGRNQHRGSADLRVRPLGRQPKTPVPTGSPTTWIGNPNVSPIQRHRSKGGRDRVAGGRTSVSAPLGIPPGIRDRTGSPTTWIGNRGSKYLKQAMHPNGSTALLSTAQLSRPPAVRTSVSAPLGIPLKICDPTGSPTAWIGNRGSPYLKQAMHPNGSTALLSTAQLSRPPAVRIFVSAPLRSRPTTRTARQRTRLGRKRPWSPTSRHRRRVHASPSAGVVP